MKRERMMMRKHCDRVRMTDELMIAISHDKKH